MLFLVVMIIIIFVCFVDFYLVYMIEFFDCFMRMKVMKMYLWNNNIYFIFLEWFFIFIRVYVDFECICIYS